MIIQTLMDFARDLLVNFLVGIAGLWPASSVDAILSELGIPANLVGHVLAVFFTASGWALLLSLLIAYAALFVGTAIIRTIIGRIGS